MLPSLGMAPGSPAGDRLGCMQPQVAAGCAPASQDTSSAARPPISMASWPRISRSNMSALRWAREARSGLKGCRGDAYLGSTGPGRDLLRGNRRVGAGGASQQPAGRPCGQQARPFAAPLLTCPPSWAGCAWRLSGWRLSYQSLICGDTKQVPTCPLSWAGCM